MEIREIFGRNLNITHDIRNRFEKLETYFLFRGKDNKNIFMLCLALGYRKGVKTPFKNATGLVNITSLTDEDLFSIAAIAVDETNEISTLSNGPLMKKTALEYVGTGLEELEQLATEHRSGENLELAIEEIAVDAVKEINIEN